MNVALAFFLLPLISSFILLFSTNLQRLFAFLLSLCPLGILLLQQGEIFGQKIDLVWSQNLSIHFHLAIDTLGVLFLYLTSVIIPLAIVTEPQRERAFYSLILLLQGLLNALFISQDLLCFTVFFESSLFPLYFLMRIWGGTQKEKASYTFILYMITGSVFLIAALLSIYLLLGSFDIKTLGQSAETLSNAWLLCAVFLFAFLVKTPMFPFHGWLPESYYQASPAGTILLASLLSKTGIYGIFRVLFVLFPGLMDSWSLPLALIALVGVFYGAFAALGQDDIKKIVAYSSFSHVNFVLVGVFIANAIARGGAILQAINHSITIAGLFMVIAWLEKALSSTSIERATGLAKSMPILCWTTLLFVLSSVALPGLNTFVSEFLILFGLFTKSSWLAAFLGATVILSVVYMLRWMHAIYFGPQNFERPLVDIEARQVFCAAPLALIIIWLGVYPKPVLEYIQQITAAGIS